jgi:hypothetical protein
VPLHLLPARDQRDPKAERNIGEARDTAEGRGFRHPAQQDEEDKRQTSALAEPEAPEQRAEHGHQEHGEADQARSDQDFEKQVVGMRGRVEQSGLRW